MSRTNWEAKRVGVAFSRTKALQQTGLAIGVLQGLGSLSRVSRPLSFVVSFHAINPRLLMFRWWQMPSLREEFMALAPGGRRLVHLSLCEHTLAKWTAYTRSRGEITYTETVCGTNQAVDPALPKDAFECAKQYRDVANVHERYREPIVALQDGDLAFPDAIEFAYYSVYNLFRKYTGIEDVDDWLIVNQALASETDETRWAPLLAAAIMQAEEGTGEQQLTNR